MNWFNLISEAQFTALLEASAKKPQVIFKHSTRCSTSAMVKNRLERSEIPAGVDFYFLDLISYRSLSGKIADELGVRHESPQILLIRDGKCIYHESHYAVMMEEIEKRI